MEFRFDNNNNISFSKVPVVAFSSVVVSPGATCTAVVGTDIQIGAGTSTSSSVPFYGLYDYSFFAGIWLDTEFTGGGERQITGIEMEVQDYITPYTYNNITVNLYHVVEDIFDSAPAIDLSDLTTSDKVTCITGHTVTITANGWITIDFDTNFCYNGTSNLLMEIKNEDGTWVSGYGKGKYDFSPAISRAAHAHADGAYPTGDGTRTNSRVNTKFKY